MIKALRLYEENGGGSSCLDAVSPDTSGLRNEQPENRDLSGFSERNATGKKSVQYSPTRRHPPWIRARVPSGPNYTELKRLMRDLELHTVCEEAQCPNIGECWESRSATFMILGDVCTRRCMFCAVTKGNPEGVDFDEPRRLGEAVGHLKLKHVVITSVNRDELSDGGASIFAECIHESRRHSPGCTVEVLIPDLEGNWDALGVIVGAKPDVLNHNTETVPRLYRRTRPQAKYQRTLDLLRIGKEMDGDHADQVGIDGGLRGKHRRIVRNDAGYPRYELRSFDNWAVSFTDIKASADSAVLHPRRNLKV